MNTRIPQILSLFFIITITSCGLKGIKIPTDKLDYVGLWKSTEIKLFISESGRVEYEKKNGVSSKTVKAPLQKFEGNNFVIGALGITTTFIVSEAPHKDNNDL